MKNKIILLYTLILSGLSVWGQNSEKVNPFSLKEDLRFELSMIEATRNKILKSISIEQLKTNLKTGDEISKLKAVEQMAYISDDEGRKEIEKLLLKDVSHEIRVACAKALGTIRSEESANALVQALKDKNNNVRIWSGISLALIGEKKESLKFFIELYSKANNIPYFSCHLGFLYIGTNDVRQYLLKDIDNKDPYIAIDAAIILAELGYNSDIFLFLKGNLTNPDKYIRMAALRGLAYIGDSSSLALVSQMVNDNDPLVKERAISILSKFK